MTKVAILPVPSRSGGIAYHAMAGDKRSQGSTAGEALDALTAQLPADDTGTLVVVQHLRPDRFFSATHQRRLEDLMTRWRAARDAGGTLPDADQDELNALIEAELRAAGERASALADESGR
jgi:hypothetical protein